MKGGKREGAGRPPAPPTAVMRIRLLIATHEAIQERGGDVWVKRVIEQALSASNHQTGQGPSA